MIRVIIADDHALVRAGVRGLLEEAGDMDVVAEAESGPDAIDSVMRHSCQVLILDISMPGRGSTETLKRLLSIRPDLRVLIFSMQPADLYAVRLIRIGAAGFVSKETAPDELVAAVRHVAKGQRYLTPEMADILSDALFDEQARPPHESLDDREFETFCLLASGRSVSEAADDLSLSVKTVSMRRRRILEKMGLSHNADLTRYALNHRLLE